MPACFVSTSVRCWEVIARLPSSAVKRRVTYSHCGKLGAGAGVSAARFASDDPEPMLPGNDPKAPDNPKAVAPVDGGMMGPFTSPAKPDATVCRGVTPPSTSSRKAESPEIGGEEELTRFMWCLWGPVKSSKCGGGDITRAVAAPISGGYHRATWTSGSCVPQRVPQRVRPDRAGGQKCP
jgi:hypothetical protein